MRALGLALIALLLLPAPALAEKQKWKEVVTPGHQDLLARLPQIINSVNGALEAKTKPGSADAHALAEVKALLARPHRNINDKQLPGNWKCKFYWMQDLGAFEYPFFRCKIGYEGRGHFFQKVNGSVRQRGWMLRDDRKRFVVPLSIHVMDETPKAYGEGGNANPDRAGVLYLLDRKTAIMLIPMSDSYYELLLLKR